MPEAARRTLCFLLIAAIFTLHVEGQFIYNPAVSAGAITYNQVNISGPSQTFLDQYALIISENLLLKNGGDPVGAFEEGLLLFNASQTYVAGIAEHHRHDEGFNIVTALANTELANITQQLGDALAAHLPHKVGLPKLPDVFAQNYTQAVLPGLITAATGITYQPCLDSLGVTGAAVEGNATNVRTFNSELLGAGAMAQGIGISPRIFNSGPLGAGAIAEAISVNPALLYIAPNAVSGVAIGASIAPHLISIGPIDYLNAALGTSISPMGLSIDFTNETSPPPPTVPPAPPPRAPAGAPAPALAAGNAPGGRRSLLWPARWL